MAALVLGSSPGNAVAVAGALPATDAAAGTAPAAAAAVEAADTNCRPADAALTRNARGGRTRDPHALASQQVAQMEAATDAVLAQQALAAKQAGGTGAGAADARTRRAARTTVVPVHVNVISGGTKARPTGRVSRARVQRQVDVLNAAFGGRTRGAATRFRFTLKGVRYVQKASWYALRPDSRHERAMKRALHRGGAGTLNVYTVSPRDDLLGWATFPQDYRRDPAQDGVVLRHSTLPGRSEDGFNLGDTGTHEVGHWLGLYHTFQDGCVGKGDHVSDTPAEAQPASGCPRGADTCRARGDDPVTNFMDYSDDSCMHKFTPGQARRMRDHWTAYRD